MMRTTVVMFEILTMVALETAINGEKRQFDAISHTFSLNGAWDQLSPAFCRVDGFCGCVFTRVDGATAGGDFTGPGNTEAVAGLGR